ncbi:MAG: hypothetical protein KC416_09050, partial [Myxococcales bacterium]|nr:hypothetical protein [Myxococcales bacterium]
MNLQTVLTYAVAVTLVAPFAWLGTGLGEAVAGETIASAVGSDTAPGVETNGAFDTTGDDRATGAGDGAVASGSQAAARVLAEAAINSYRFARQGGSYVPSEEARLALQAVSAGSATQGQRIAHTASIALTDPHLRRWLDHAGQDRIHFRLSDGYSPGVYRESSTGNWFARRLQDDGAFEYHFPRSMLEDPLAMARSVANDLVAETGGARLRVEGKELNTPPGSLLGFAGGTAAVTAAGTTTGVLVADWITPLTSSGLTEAGVVIPAVAAAAAGAGGLF